MDFFFFFFSTAGSSEAGSRTHTLFGFLLLFFCYHGHEVDTPLPCVISMLRARREEDERKRNMLVKSAFFSSYRKTTTFWKSYQKTCNHLPMKLAHFLKHCISQRDLTERQDSACRLQSLYIYIF